MIADKYGYIGAMQCWVTTQAQIIRCLLNIFVRLTQPTRNQMTITY